jgi:hypothetical protein
MRVSVLPARAALAAAALFCAAASVPCPARAQQQPLPAPRDTLPRPRRDTIPGRRDTLTVPIPPEQQAHDTLPDKSARDSVPADSARPAPNFPTWPEPPSGSWSGSWTLTRADLDHYQGMSLLELLERVPGILVLRTGTVGQPAAISQAALGGGRLRVFMDGYELLPISYGTVDVQQISLADLQSLRVERGPAGIRVDVSTFRLEDRRPFAQVEAGDGDFSSRTLRGFFARVFGGGSVFQGTYDLEDTGGFARVQPFTSTTFGARYSRTFGPDRGVQIEYRRVSVDRDEIGTGAATGTGNIFSFPESTDRTDLVLRGRARLAGGLWVDAFAGRSRREPAGTDSVTIGGAATQLGGRAALTVPLGDLSAEARLVRGDDRTFSPDETDLQARADLHPLPWLAASGQVRSLTLAGVTGLETEASARVGPAAGFTFFGTLAAGKRPVRWVRDSTFTRRTFGGLGGGTPAEVAESTHVFGTATESLTGLRLGGEWNHGTILLGGAAVRLDPEQVASFGLGFDSIPRPVGGAATDGVEAYASLPLYFHWLRFDGWYTRLNDTADRPYLPLDYGSGSVQYHNTFFTGNLEPTARIEGVVRGPAAVPDQAGGFTARTQRYALFNFFLQIRIIDVRVFVRAENLLSRRTAVDVPPYFLPGTRTIYGFRWFFRN